MAKSKIKKEKVDNVGIHSFSKKADIFFSTISGLVALSCILPFVFVIVISVTDEKSILQNGYSFFPSQFGLDGFEFLAQFKDKILQALFISVFVTVVGTITNVLSQQLMPTPSHGQPLSIVDLYNLCPFLVCVQRWFGTRLYRGNSFTSTW